MVVGACAQCPKSHPIAPAGAVGLDACSQRVAPIASERVAYGITAAVAVLALLVVYAVLISQREARQMSWTTVLFLGFTCEGFFVFSFAMLDFLSDVLYFLTEPFYHEGLKWSCLSVLCLPQLGFCAYLLVFSAPIKETTCYLKCSECIEFTAKTLTDCCILPAVYDWHIPFGWGDTDLSKIERVLVVVIWNVMLKPISWLILVLLLLMVVLTLMLGSLACFVFWLCFGFVLWNLKLLIYDRFAIFWLVEAPAGSRTVVNMRLFLLMELAELVLEDGPQFIIQFVNNELMGEWSTLAIVSVAVEALLVLRLSHEILWKTFKMDMDFWSGEIFDDFIVHLSVPGAAPAAPAAPAENAANPVHVGMAPTAPTAPTA